MRLDVERRRVQVLLAVNRTFANSCLVATVVAAASGCSTQPTKTEVVAVATPTAVATPAAHSHVKASATGVAVPGCTGPEVEPAWWSPNCGDAGYQIEPVWDSWSATSAAAHGVVRITHGADAGKSWLVHAVFDRPQKVAAYGGRPLFSRFVVRYDDSRGPNGTPSETMQLQEIWETAVAVTSTG